LVISVEEVLCYSDVSHIYMYSIYLNYLALFNGPVFPHITVPLERHLFQFIMNCQCHVGIHREITNYSH